MATTAEEGDKREPPGLGPRNRRSAATLATSGDMAGGDGEGEGEEGAMCYVLSLPAAALPLPVAVSCLDATVPRKARSRVRLRAPPSGWWAFKLPAPAPEAPRSPVPPASAAGNPSEEARDPRPPRLRVRTAPPGAQAERPSKRARRCLQCGAAETPRWRSGPMGQGTLCNACGVRLKAAGALREQVHRPPPATARTVAEPPPPPESPVSESSPGSPIWQPGSVPDVYLMRKKPPMMKRGTMPRPPRTRTRTEPVPPPPPPAVLPVYLVKKKKKKKKSKAASSKKPWRPRDSAKRCLHCGSSSTPQWREGPMGRSTLCNACGVRYRQGRLLPEYRPMASPTFEPSEHASRHSQVLQLHRQRKCQNHQHPPPTEKLQPHPVYDSATTAADDDELPQRWVKNEYPPTPLHRPLPQPVDSLTGGNLRDGGTDDVVAGRGDAPSSLDSLLLEGPSAPLIVDGDEPLIV